MGDRKKQKLVTGCCLAAFAFFALICLVMHFSIAGLLVFIGAVMMTAGLFAGSLQKLIPCGFAVAALAYVIEFVWYLSQSISRGFRWFYLLFPVLACLLMIAIFLSLLKITLHPDHSKAWGAAVTAAAFAVMLLVVGTAFAGYFKGAGEMNYFVFLQRLVLIPAGWFFGLMMEGEEPLMAIDLSFLKKNAREEEPGGQVIGYTPDGNQYRHRRPSPMPEENPENTGKDPEGFDAGDPSEEA